VSSVASISFAQRRAPKPAARASPERWISIAFVGCAHALAFFWALQYEPVRTALAQAPMMFSLTTSAPERPAPVKRVEPPKPRRVEPEPPPQVLATPTPSPAPVVVPPPEPVPAAPAPQQLVTAPPVVVTPPRFDAAYLNNPPPPYPSQARFAGEQGTVTLRVFVNAEGRAEKIEIARSSGSARLDDSALQTVSRWRFVPARQSGEAIGAWVLVPIVFSLQG